MYTLMTRYNNWIGNQSFGLTWWQVNIYLIIDEPFTADDIITIQDPKDMKKGFVAEFDYLKNNIPFVPPEKIRPEIK